MVKKWLLILLGVLGVAIWEVGVVEGQVGVVGVPWVVGRSDRIISQICVPVKWSWNMCIIRTIPCCNCIGSLLLRLMIWYVGCRCILLIEPWDIFLSFRIRFISFVPLTSYTP